MVDKRKEDLYQKIREYVRQQQEEHGREDPIPLDEIAQKFGISVELIYDVFSQRAEIGEIDGMDLFVTFID